MALRKFAPAATVRLGIVLEHQRSLYLLAINPCLKKVHPSLLRNQLGSQIRNLRCSPFYLYAAGPSRTSSVNASNHVAAERSGNRRKGKGSSDVPKIKERPVVFECQECEALCVKRVQQEHFEKGVVIVRCLECRSVNLVADNVGLFKEKDSMQKFLSERGVNVRYGDEGSYELLAEDLAKMAAMDENQGQVLQQQQEEQQPEQQHQETTAA